MRVKLIGDETSQAYELAREVVTGTGSEITRDWNCDVAIAPLLTKIMSYSELSKPRHGTLIFHPSPLPYGRGAAAIRWAYKRREPITGATWFWANSGGVDSGDICEGEVILIDYSQRPRDFYTAHILPAMERTLRRCLLGITLGYPRRIPQVEAYSSFDYK